ncbi:MAG: transcriptional repressor LexA [candidate division Zixibacteria bacterium]|nr:transcriptional repressor LexA [candidate division Zixibacteria bacterium]
MTVREKLTRRQKEILEYIEKMITEYGKSPTIREIGEKFNISSTNGVRSHLEVLLKKGYIRRQKLISRGIELVRNMAGPIKRIPLVGAVPAGNPLTAIENIEGEIAVDTSFLPSGETFTLRVKGESMKNAGIFDGDYVLVKRQKEAEPGEIVVAVIGDEATVKRYFPEEGRIKLQPENESFEPIWVDKNSPDFYIAGKVVGLLRRIP